MPSSKINCCYYMKCEKEPEGDKVAEACTCPAIFEEGLDYCKNCDFFKLQADKVLDITPLEKPKKTFNFKDLTGQTIGRLTVIEKVNAKQYRNDYWRCKCFCGKEKIIFGGSLRKNKPTQSCGCLARERVARARKNDLTNKIFGKLTVIRTTKKRHHGRIVWLCKCDCGNYHEVPSVSLVTGRTKSCGCLKREKSNRTRKRDLTNKIFGKLTAIKETEKRYYGSIVWLCKCECGNYHEVPSVSLVTGSTKSCGCLMNNNNMDSQKVLKYQSS